MLRALAVALLAWAWLLSLGAVHRHGAETAESMTLRARLERWSTVAPPREVTVRFDAPPAVVERDWLAALRRAGTVVRWSGPAMAPMAATVARSVDPAGGVEVSVAAPAGATVLLRDTLGLRDSVVAPNAPQRFQLTRLEEGTSAVVGVVVAHDLPRDSLAFRRLLLLGRASWESRFVAAALTERGWIVDARFVVAPGSDVYQGIVAPRPAQASPAEEPAARQSQAPNRIAPQVDGGAPGMPRAFGAPAPPVAAPVTEPPVRIAIDTARYSAVLAIDSTAARHGAAIARYLRDGGGLVLWSDAAATPALHPFAAGGSGTEIPVQSGAVPDSLPRAALGLVPIVPLHHDAVALETRGSLIAVGARRIGMGRVVEIGYVDSWRWPMGGGESAPERYRAWLAGLVAQVALVGRVPVGSGGTDPVPVAGLLDRLGPSTAAFSDAQAERDAIPAWIFAVLLSALLIEWSSRRIRGLR